MAKKPRIVRPEDAIKTRDQLRQEADPERRRLLWLKAEFQELFGWINRHNGFPRRGRPAGTKQLRPGDDAALAFMESAAIETGEKRPYVLAGCAYDAGCDPSGNPNQRATTVRRWAKAWATQHRN